MTTGRPFAIDNASNLETAISVALTQLRAEYKTETKNNCRWHEARSKAIAMRIRHSNTVDAFLANQQSPARATTDEIGRRLHAVLQQARFLVSLQETIAARRHAPRHPEADKMKNARV